MGFFTVLVNKNSVWTELKYSKHIKYNWIVFITLLTILLKSHNVKMRLYENISACLLNKNKGCLKKHIQEKIYFFEQVDFGCHTTDTDKNYSSALEFSECTMTSQKRNDTCGSKALTLLEALKDCFSDAKSKFKDNYFYGPGGYVCYYYSIALKDEKAH